MREIRFCYVRFGKKDSVFPPEERSKNHSTGKLENGVSVYEAIERNGIYQILLPRIDSQTIATLGNCFNVAQGLWGQENYPLWEVDGDLVGEGSDGEPLLKNCRAIKKIFE